MSLNFSETKQHYAVFLAELKIVSKTLDLAIESFSRAIDESEKESRKPINSVVLEILNELELLDNWFRRCQQRAEEIKFLKP